jgi:hypothetical protein
MEWFHYFAAALSLLSELSPVAIAQFHGGAHNTATKVGSALAIVDSVTTQLSHQFEAPTVDPGIVHGEVHDAAVAIKAASTSVASEPLVAGDDPGDAGVAGSN